ncbi:MAG: sigma-54 dependent transcriptional regulator [Spirochaetes bacterium]|nr:sigma-54 dependent transcriptional regulator [Spirochaetota bacterium]
MDFLKICGQSRQIKELIEVSSRIANTDATVLITGESGTGKELFANYIQKYSSRRDQPFITINCAAIPGALLENEFFGHKKGAFTDALDDQIGKFGYANGGTVFLDEIGELELSLQAKLLRFIQSKRYQPIGSNQDIESDVRIISATNKDLFQLITENKFREDLFYRLNVVPIKIPPLRERKDDILAIADYYFDFYNTKYQKKLNSVSNKLKQKLLNHAWRGNVRELQNVIEKAVVLAKKNSVLTDIDLNEEKQPHSSNKEIKSLKEAVDDFKKDYIIYSLNQNNWNQTKTAEKLQIQRTYLARLIKELKINKL